MNGRNTLRTLRCSDEGAAAPGQAIARHAASRAAAGIALLSGACFPALAPAAERARAGQDDSSMATLAIVVCVALVAAAVAGGVWYWRRWQQRRRAYSHSLLFNDLCRLHEIPRRDRALLAQLAKVFQLSHPARVFIEPKWLEAGRSHPALSAQQMDLAAIGARIFAEETDA